MTTNRVKLLWEFVKEYNWKRIDYDSAFWYQCVDLMRKWLDKIWYVQPKKLGNNWVIKIAQNPNYYLATPEDWIPNTPEWVPAPGDVVIFNKPSDTWHVAVVISATIKTITVFEQNAGRWSKTGTGSDACRITDVDYKNVMWWINTQTTDTAELESVKQVMSANSKLWETTKNQSVKDKTNADNNHRRSYYWIK